MNESDDSKAEGDDGADSFTEDYIEIKTYSNNSDKDAIVEIEGYPLQTMK